MANGCGIFGLYSKIYRKLKGKPAPFEYACVEHDEDYECVATKAERLAADDRFYLKIVNSGHLRTAKIFYHLVRCFGWVAIIRRDMKRYNGEVKA